MDSERSGKSTAVVRMEDTPGGSKKVTLKARKLRTGREVRQVLAEEKYVKKLGKIIERDYYPDLPKLKAQYEYLEAMEQGDTAKIRALHMRYNTARATTEMTRAPSPTGRPAAGNPQAHSPSTFETPADDAGASHRPATDANRPATSAEGPGDDADKSEGGKKQDKDADVKKLTVDQFLTKYTSEDNASFEELSKMHERQERMRRAWIYRAEEEHNARMVKFGPEELPPADVQLALPPTERPVRLDNWPIKAKQPPLFQPAGAPFTEEELAQRRLVATREIAPEKTRIEGIVWNESRRQDSMGKAASWNAAMQRGNVDAHGNEVAAFKVPAQQFSFVATPSPAPGVNESPLMTWGEIDGTPFRLDAGDFPISAGGPQFKIPDVPQRDQLALKLADQVSRNYSDKRKTAVKVAANVAAGNRMQSAATRLASMSPAARRLATSKLGIRLGTDGPLSYSPSPRRPSTQNRTPKGTPLKSPLVVPKGPADTASAGGKTSSITDDLLGPSTSSKRPRAEDMF